MVRVKICGITSVEDALHAASCGADALGFVFYEASPRAVDPEAVREIVEALPPFVSTVGLFVNERPERIGEIVSFCGLDLVQLHGDEAPGDCLFPPRRVIKALRVRDASSLESALEYPVSALLLDAWSKESYGGTGLCFNWDLAASVAGDRTVILAGGLHPGNVAEAVRVVRPYGVDVSSGVESAAGKKDPEKVADFIRNAKAQGEQNLGGGDPRDAGLEL